MTGEFNALAGYLRRWDGRRRRRELLIWLPRGLLIGLLAALAVAFLGRARPLLTRGELGLAATALALIALSITALVVLLRRRSLGEQARFADRQFALRERMVAAVEIAGGQLAVPEELAARQLDDALIAAASVDPVRQLSLTNRPADWLPALATLSLLAVLLWLPNPQEAILQENREVVALARDQAEVLAALTEQIATDENLTIEQRESLQQPLDEALAALAEPGIGREELLAALSQAETEMQVLSQEFDATLVAERLAAAADALGENPAAADLAVTLEAGQLGEASAATGELAAALDDLTPAERADLAEHLAVTAVALGETDPELAAGLGRAAETLAAGDTAAAQEALRQVAATLDDRARSAAAAEQATGAVERLGAARDQVAQSGAQSGGAEASGEQDTGQSGTSSGSDATGNGGQQGGAAGVSEGGGHVENVFVPPSVDLGGEGEAVELETQCLDDPASCGPVGEQSPSPLDDGAGSQVPYDRVFGDYRDAAFEALTGGDIPLRLQDLVRDYFTALEP
jgi:hypothetical protein